ncbi:MAG: hypothetical protein EHM93_00055 [Bacteroidales bacterium]|nr:MAG: hypothetical protein EHM93_00055 [Bacteroidales bacterium]
MKKSILMLVISLMVTSIFSQSISKPEDFFGFKPGTDRMLFTYEKLVDYLKVLDNQSDRLKLIEIGTSPMGKPIFMALISSEQNIRNLDRLKDINKRLALDYLLPEADRSGLVNEGKVFVYATLSMHSSEVAPSQALPLIAYDWVTSNEPSKLEILNDVVYMVVACHNPDGMDMVVDHYNKYKDTKYESTTLPGVYHKYVGHDNNRDFIVLTQTDSKAISEITSTSWLPQVMVEKHQMGSTGARYFVPPNHDPIAENIDPKLWTWNGIFGQNMINDMTAKGLTGICQHTLFDNYWPGSTETCLWKNVISFLTEAASVQVAKPIFVEPTELSVWGKGLSEYKISANMPAPWPGGWWRLGDIVQYEIESTNSILNTASIYKDRILTFRNDICKSDVKRGQNQAPYYFIVPENQQDKSEMVELVNLLKEHGVEVSRLSNDFTLNGINYKKGDIVVSLAQPFRSFIKEVMEPQKYPERHYTPGGELIEPYDITSWSLPLHKGLKSIQIDTRNLDFEKQIEKINGKFTLANNKENFEYAILTSTSNQSYKLVFEALNNSIKVDRCANEFDINGVKVPAGSFIIKKQDKLIELLKTSTFPIVYVDNIPSINLNPVPLPRIALVESYMHDMDAGWTRYVLDSYAIKYTQLRPKDFETTELSKNFDIIIFPDEDASILKDGKTKRGEQYFQSNLPPEFSKGMGTKGFESLMNYIALGGTVISWGESTALFEGALTIKDKTTSEEFRLPFRNDGDQLAKKGLECPGSLVKINVLGNHPISWGVPKTIGIFYRGAPAFSTSIPNFDMDRRVIGFFEEENTLLSGYLKNEKLLYNKSALVWVKKGKAQFVLMGFSPIFRASSAGTYKLLFNSILLPKIQ